jgi:DNA repair protein RecN (Recombination protein N)
MLVELHIENFALVERQSISFGPGLNVISGETGSGKSILLSAIQFLLGERPRTSPLRTGAERGEVQGLFSLESLGAEARVGLPDILKDEHGVLADEVSVVREVHRSGKSKVFLNGRLASVSLLEQVMSRLVNICGQNQHVRLLDPRFHLETLDGFGGFKERVQRFRERFDRWREVCRQLSDAERETAERSQRETQLLETVAELTAARLRPGIRAELEARVRALSHAARLNEAGQRVLCALSDDESGVGAQLKRIQSEVSEMERLDPSFSQCAQLFTSARRELREFEFSVQRAVSAITEDESQLEELRTQLAEVARLERKYRKADGELVELLAEMSRELDQRGAGQNLAQLRKEREIIEEALKQESAQLSAERAAAADRLASEVEGGLSEVAMGGSKFRVELLPTTLGPSGSDRAEFLLSSNRGEPERPLREIASGGELSRILLVLKQVLSDRTGVNVLVFDEVDTGISGAVARAVGKKLRALAASSQVICVTHLPQVASLADQHFLVDKREIKGAKARTITHIEGIEGDRRVDEIARMLAGYTVTAAARESARELLSSKE